MLEKRVETLLIQIHTRRNIAREKFQVFSLTIHYVSNVNGKQISQTARLKQTNSACSVQSQGKIGFAPLTTGTACRRCMLCRPEIEFQVKFHSCRFSSEPVHHGSIFHISWADQTIILEIFDGNNLRADVKSLRLMFDFSSSLLFF